MRRLFETIKELILLFLLLGFGSAFIDFARISTGNNPLFCVKNFSQDTKIETFQGLFYTGSRKVTNSSDEKFLDSSQISFNFLTLPISVPKQFSNTVYEYHITPHFSDSCSNKLYYADLNTKVYLYCIDSLDYLEKTKDEAIPFSSALKDNSQLIEDFIVKNNFVSTNNNVLEFKSFEEIISPDVVIYRCQSKNNNSIIIAPSGYDYQEDFCSNKDDDLDFIWTVLDENKSYSDALEIIYEDDNYQYELAEGNKDNIFVVYPSVRGRDEKKVPLMEIINNNTYSINELIDHGLIITKVVKES